MQVANFIWQLSTTNGLSNLTLTNNDSFVDFFSQFGADEDSKFFYGIHNRSAVEWEVGIGYLLSPTVMVRDTVLKSSNGDALVNFSTGLKDVSCDVPASFQLLTTSLGSMAQEDVADYYNKTQADTLLAGKANTSHQHTGSDVIMSRIGSSTYSTVQHLMNFCLSPGISSEAGITVSATPGAIDVSDGTGLIKAVDSNTAEISFFDWDEVIGLAIPNDSTRYIGVEYNFGSPQVVARTVDNFNLDTEFPLGVVVNEDGTIYISNIPWTSGDNMANVIERFDSISSVARDERTGGLIISSTGTRNISVSSGAILSRMSEFDISPIDTSISGIFDAYYRDGSGGWLKQSSQTQFDNLKYDNDSGILVNLTSMHYSSRWFYLMTDGTLAMIYGQNNDAVFSDALNDGSPSNIPDRILKTGLLIGRLIIQQSISTPAATQTTFETKLSAAGVNSFDDLAGIAKPTQGGTGAVNDDLSTITINGAFPLTFALSGPTNVAVPPTGTLSVVGHTHTSVDITDFTTAAKAATVSNTITNGVTDVAPSQDAVFDALATKSNTGHTHTASEVTDFPAAADARIALQKGAINGIATLDAGGKIPSAQLPAIAISDTFVVASQAAQIALTAEIGDVAVRTDLNKSYILRINNPAIFANWQELLTPTDSVLSVNGQTGTVVLTTTNISEGTNLYYTQGRFDSAFAAKSTTDLAEGTNLYYTATRFNNAFAAKSTTDLAEGTNLYYTATRFNVAFAGKTTTDLAEGTNLYYTTARFDTAFATKTTTNLTEGTNLYFTNSRADARISLQKGAANGIATLDAGGKIPSAQLPAIAISDTFVVASQAAQVALTAETGDVAVRTDLNKSYILRVNDPTIFANWQELLTPTDSVLSVNGQTGAVVLTTTNIAEGTNLYYTTARFDTAFATKTTTNLTEGTNLYYTVARFNTAFASKSTTDLAEGTNLYYTDERVDDRVAALIQNGTGLSWTYVDGSNTLTGNVSLASFTTTNLAEGTNLYYTTARFDTAFATKTTTNLSEGTNLYYTNARVDAEIPVAIHAATNKTTPVDADEFPLADSAASFGLKHVTFVNLRSALNASNRFTSTDQTITAAGAVGPINHGLGAKPVNTCLELICVTGEAGFTAGDALNMAGIAGVDVTGTENCGVSIVNTSTQITGRFGSNASTFIVPHRTTGVSTALTNANWNLRITVFR